MKKQDPSVPAEYAETELRPVDWSKELDRVRSLFRDYRAWLAEHAARSATPPPGLSQLDAVIAELPGVYGPPGGDVILAVKDSEVVACGALRRWEPGVGEIKRIYVRADHRGPGFGPILTRALLDRARKLGYKRVRVDTLPTMAAAIQFYQELGFRPIPAYWENPVEGALYFEWRGRGRERASRDTSAPLGRAKEVDEYIGTAPMEVRPLLRAMRRAIREAAPEAVEKISYGMPFYSFAGEPGFAGRLCYFGLSKKNVTFYARPQFLAEFREAVGPYRSTKSSLHFPLDRPLPLPLIRDIVRSGIRSHGKGRSPRRGRKA